MTDRWNPKWITRPVERELKIFVPDGVSPHSSTVEPRGKTWGIRRRGDIEGQVKHAYRCPVHGEFEAMVPRSETPDAVTCPARVNPGDCPVPGGCENSRCRERCAQPSPWAGSLCGIGHAAGEVMS